MGHFKVTMLWKISILLLEKLEIFNILKEHLQQTLTRTARLEHYELHREFHPNHSTFIILPTSPIECTTPLFISEKYALLSRYLNDLLSSLPLSTTKSLLHSQSTCLSTWWYKCICQVVRNSSSSLILDLHMKLMIFNSDAPCPFSTNSFRLIKVKFRIYLRYYNRFTLSFSVIGWSLKPRPDVSEN